MVTGLQHAKKHRNIKMGTFYQRKLKGKKWEKRANKLIYKHDCQAKSMFYMYILEKLIKNIPFPELFIS